VSQLKQMVKTDQIRGTELIEIRVRHGKAQDARDIAEAVTEAYKERREDVEEERASRALAALQNEVRAQEDAVEDKRKLFHTVLKAFGIPYVEGLRSSGQMGQAEEELLTLAKRQEYEMKKERQELNIQIQTLLRLEDEELMEYARGLSLPDNGVPKLHEEYQRSVRDIATMRASGLGAKHPQVEMMKTAAEGLKNDLQKAVVNLQQILEYQLQLVDGRLQEMQETLTRTEDDAVDKALKSQDYIEARGEYESAKAILETMKITHSPTRSAKVIGPDILDGLNHPSSMLPPGR
jgi:hypothetical protein